MEGASCLPAGASGRTVFLSTQMRCYKIHALLQLIYFISRVSSDILQGRNWPDGKLLGVSGIVEGKLEKELFKLRIRLSGLGL